jgi:hypothetical protein
MNWYKGVAVAVLFAGCAWSQAFGQMHYGPVPNYSCWNLADFTCWHYHPPEVMDELVLMRKHVHRYVRNNDPVGAVGALRRITTLCPHDYDAWSFLSYSYAVMGDAPSAANVDLDIVAMFEFVPDAAVYVANAMTRLQMWDPRGWRRRVEDTRSTYFPVVPRCACDHFLHMSEVRIESVEVSHVYTRIEQALTTVDERLHFIKTWSRGGPCEGETHATVCRCPTCQRVMSACHP